MTKGSISSLIIPNKQEQFSRTQKGCSGKVGALGSGYAALWGMRLGCDPPILPRRGSLAQEIDRKTSHMEGLNKGNSVDTELT